MVGVVIPRVACVFPDVLGSFVLPALCVTPVECVANFCVLLVNRFSLCLTDLGYFFFFTVECECDRQRCHLSRPFGGGGCFVLQWSS